MGWLVLEPGQAMGLKVAPLQIRARWLTMLAAAVLLVGWPDPQASLAQPDVGAGRPTLAYFFRTYLSGSSSTWWIDASQDRSWPTYG